MTLIIPALMGALAWAFTHLALDGTVAEGFIAYLVAYFGIQLGLENDLR